jgi:hypothetical protein
MDEIEDLVNRLLTSGSCMHARADILAAELVELADHAKSVPQDQFDGGPQMRKIMVDTHNLIAEVAVLFSPSYMDVIEAFSSDLLRAMEEGEIDVPQHVVELTKRMHKVVVLYKAFNAQVDMIAQSQL